MALTENQLVGYLRDFLAFDVGHDIEAELFSNGALNSVAMLNLIAFVEETSGIQVRPSRLPWRISTRPRGSCALP